MYNTNNNLTPEVSVIVPVYNTSKFVKRCLISLIKQDFDRGYEIIVINDGSTDNSLEIVEKIAARHSNIRVYSQKNGGLSAARNTGLGLARGKYVMFTDSDDFVSGRYISAMYYAAENSGADIAYCNFCCVNEHGAPSSIDGILKHRAGVFPAEKMLRSLLLDITIRSFAWNKLYRRSLFTEHGIEFPVGKLYEDMRTTPKLFYHAKKITVVNEVLYGYVQHSGSITGTMTAEKVFKYINSYGSIRKFLNEERIYQKYASAYKIQAVKVGFTAVPMLIGCKFRDKSVKLAECCGRAVYMLYNFSN